MSVLLLLNLVLTCITTIVAVFMMFCMMFVYRSIQNWRPLVNQSLEILLSRRAVVPKPFPSSVVLPSSS